MAGLRIGALAERTGTSAPTIRYYEHIGLLPPASRQAGGQRSYGEDDVRRLTLIRRCREFGFSIQQVRSLVALRQDPGRPCMAARDMAREHLAQIRSKLAELKALERSVSRFVDECEARCVGGPGPDCVVLADLSLPAEGGSRRRGARPV
ncbi:helix-turn-helix domain-containing protein [Inquilinus limosus]|uniref:MerR family transcriptional regulator n=1 Tax=Inquilinus limosus TaxID=171674 RepID=UPI003F1793DA